MKREYVYSLLFHVMVVGALLISSPFSAKSKWDPNDVIKVSLSGPLPMKEMNVAKLPTLQPGRTAPPPQAAVPISNGKSVPITKSKAKPSTQAKQKPKRPTDPSELFGPATTQIEAPGTEEGSPFAGASIDNENFQYPYWFVQAFNKISSNFKVSTDLDGTVVCVIYFQVIRSGRVIESRVVKTSGVPAFDNDCLLAIERSTPFPPLPREFPDEIIGITLPVKYGPR